MLLPIRIGISVMVGECYGIGAAEKVKPEIGIPELLPEGPVLFEPPGGRCHVFRQETKGTAGIETARHIEIFEQRDGGKATHFLENRFSDEEPPVSKAQTRERKAGTVAVKTKQRRPVVERQSERTGFCRRVAERGTNCIQTLRWEMGVSMKEKEHVADSFLRTAIHLRSPPGIRRDDARHFRCLQHGFVLRAAVHHDHLERRRLRADRKERIPDAFGFVQSRNDHRDVHVPGPRQIDEREPPDFPRTPYESSKNRRGVYQRTAFDLDRGHKRRSKCS